MDSCKKLDQVLDLRLRRVLAIIFGTVEMLFFGGIIFGFNALTPVLQKEGIFSDLCDKSANKTAGCSEQTTIYSYAFITYMVVQMVMLFIVGFLVDRVGLRIVKLSASILFSIGAALFAVASARNSWLIFPAGSLVCVGGMAGLICNLSFSKLFTKTSVFVLAFITGSYDAASSVFAVFAIAYEAGFSYKLAFFLLAGVSLAMNIFSSLFIATYRLSDMAVLLSERFTPLSANDSGPQEFNDAGEENKNNPLTKLSTQEEQISGIIRGYYPTVLASLRSLPFILITCFFSFAMVRFTFFLTQFGVLIEVQFPDQPVTRQRLAQVLSFSLAGGIFAGMACGFTIDYLRSRMRPSLTKCLAIGANSTLFWLRLCPHAVPMLVVTTAATFLSAFVFLPYEGMFYVDYFILVVMRGFLFSTISSFIMTAFPIEQFGTLYGISGSLAGAFSCIQYALLSLPVTAANVISCFFVPLMGAVPLTVLVKGIKSWQKH
ncbi:solute carrier family 43 [Echinococcus multilocularis]|uniref:Solute carrier family 43 n=1 Tax=Echinococcus multilocularis TaxID=6211 RepID=A0A068Y5W5_ECHMU|nr:solute carrier family 43 [Echinococcus multilocularis]